MANVSMFTKQVFLLITLALGGCTTMLERKQAEQIFWSKIQNNIDRAEVYLIPSPLNSTDLKDVHEEKIKIEKIPDSGINWEEKIVLNCWIFFVDLHPEANWSHPCSYYLVTQDKDMHMVEHDWPPSEKLPLIHLPRPQ